MLVLIGIVAALQAAGAQPSQPIRVQIETSLGVIEAEIDSARAPRTATNFLKYVDAGAYTRSRFHRTVHEANQPNDSVRIAVVQASIDTSTGARDGEPIALERTSVTGLRHLDGTLSMARGGPDTATSSFFICIGDQPSLDYGGGRNRDGQGFAAFGRVTKGMEIVRAIQRSPADGQRLTPPVGISRISRVK